MFPITSYERITIALDCVNAWVKKIGWDGLQELVETRNALIELQTSCACTIDSIERSLAKEAEGSKSERDR